MVIEFVLPAVSPFVPVQLMVNGPKPLGVTVKLAEEPAQTALAGVTVQVGGGAMNMFISAVALTLSIHWFCAFGFITVPLVYSNSNCREPAVTSAAVSVYVPRVMS